MANSKKISGGACLGKKTGKGKGGKGGKKC